MTKHRAVSVSDRRAWNRMARIVQSAAGDVLPREHQALATEIAKAVANECHREGLALTWQARP